MFSKKDTAYGTDDTSVMSSNSMLESQIRNKNKGQSNIKINYSQKPNINVQEINRLPMSDTINRDEIKNIIQEIQKDMENSNNKEITQAIEENEVQTKQLIQYEINKFKHQMAEWLPGFVISIIQNSELNKNNNDMALKISDIEKKINLNLMDLISKNKSYTDSQFDNLKESLNNKIINFENEVNSIINFKHKSRLENQIDNSISTKVNNSKKNSNNEYIVQLPDDISDSDISLAYQSKNKINNEAYTYINDKQQNLQFKEPNDDIEELFVNDEGILVDSEGNPLLDESGKISRISQSAISNSFTL